jgi:alpha-glucosidase
MFFTKFPHPANCVFATHYDPATGRAELDSQAVHFEVQAYEGDIYCLTAKCPQRWDEPRKVVDLLPPAPLAEHGFEISADVRMSISDAKGEFLNTPDGRSFGVTGSTWMLCFEVTGEARYFGMGEKQFGRMELSGLRTKFWNTDVWSDFHWAQWGEHAADPPYLSVPYVIVRDRDGFVGILVNSGYPAFFETPGTDDQRVFVEWQRTSPHLLVGSEGGQPEIWILRAPTLRSLTRKFQKLVGVTPTPPLWALGYHQSRWGYAGEEDLFELDAKFRKNDIPCDGLWLDIDYMQGYRVFTIDRSHYPRGVESCFTRLLAADRRVVAILDPGVKYEPGYTVYDDGHRAGHFCLSPEGREFIGLVWPGETVFPDFTLAAVRDWWASYVADFCRQGFGGFWVDMNDPSTGPVDPQGMLFNQGKDAHAAHRNQYAFGMQKATFDGMIKARPDERPFILSRSGSQGTSRYSAVWTGDNVSNYAYLKQTIPTSLNLSLSGIPFNGPDIGGFGGDSEEGLMLDWMKACFLFPFTRNHTGFGTKPQEPWAYSEAANQVLARYIRLRYELMPYIYNLYCVQEEVGDPILRPLCYEFNGDFDNVNDQFLVGSDVLQAPILDAKKRSRSVILPGKAPWFDAINSDWTKPGKKRVKPSYEETPLFIRNGAILPMHRPGRNPVNLSDVELHIFAAPGTEGHSRYTYRADDGLTYGYRRGERSVLEIEVTWTPDRIEIQAECTESGFRSFDVEFVLHAGSREITLNRCKTQELPTEGILVGKPFRARSVVLAPVPMAKAETEQGSPR